MDVQVLRWPPTEFDPDTVYEAPLSHPMTRGTYICRTLTPGY
jgi:hypothetical protein